MRLSIIIPFYNGEAFIEQCLNNVKKQGLDTNDYEIILVNDGSIDKSVEKINVFEKELKNIRIIHHQKNLGLAAARNTGIGEARGNYIYFLDADDFLIKNALSLLLNCAEKKQLQILGFDTLNTSIYDIDENDKLTIGKVKLDVEGLGASFMAKYYHRNEAWWYLIDREYLLKTGLKFPEGKLLEDNLFTLQLLINSEKMGYTSQAFHRYFFNPNSIINSKEPAHYYRLLWDYERVVNGFIPVINKIEQQQPIENTNILIKQLKSRQESFIIFMIYRALKYGLSFEEFKSLIQRLEKKDLYPMRNIMYKNHDWRMKIAVILFNNKIILYAISKLYKKNS